MSRASVFHLGRSGNLNLTVVNPGSLKPMTYKFILVASPLLGIIKIGKGLVGSVSR